MGASSVISRKKEKTVDANQADPRLAAARRLHQLALDYAARSHATQAALVASFAADAAELTAEIGEILIEDQDDERLTLTALGTFHGQVRNDEADGWQSISSPDDVAENYDPVDLFSDVASALEDEFPELSESVAEADVEGNGEEAAAPDEPSDGPGSATLRSLDRLRAAGVLNEAEYEAKKAELDR